MGFLLCRCLLYSRSVTVRLTSQQGGFKTRRCCSPPPLLRRLQLHKLVDHSFQSVEHDIIAEDKHLQSPFLLVQQHGLTGCARHVVDVLYGATCNLLTVELDNDRSCTATRFRHSLLKCVNHRCKWRFDVRSALLVAQYSKKFFVRWDDRAMCELRDIFLASLIQCPPPVQPFPLLAA